MRQTLAIALLMLSSMASAANQTSSVQALLQQGYEIKATTFVPLSDVKANWAEASAGSMLVTLQKERSIAVCEFNWANWSSLAQATFENAELCRVR